MMLQTNRSAPYLAEKWGTETCSLSPFVDDWINKETNEKERSQAAKSSVTFLFLPLISPTSLMAKLPHRNMLYKDKTLHSQQKCKLWHAFIYKWTVFGFLSDRNHILVTFPTSHLDGFSIYAVYLYSCSVYTWICTSFPSAHHHLSCPLFLSHRLQSCLKMATLLTSHTLPPLKKEKDRVLIKGSAKKLPLFCFCTSNTRTRTHTHSRSQTHAHTHSPRWKHACFAYEWHHRKVFWGGFFFWRLGRTEAGGRTRWRGALWKGETLVKSLPASVTRPAKLLDIPQQGSRSRILSDPDVELIRPTEPQVFL